MPSSLATVLGSKSNACSLYPLSHWQGQWPLMCPSCPPVWGELAWHITLKGTRWWIDRIKPWGPEEGVPHWVPGAHAGRHHPDHIEARRTDFLAAKVLQEGLRLWLPWTQSWKKGPCGGSALSPLRNPQRLLFCRIAGAPQALPIASLAGHKAGYHVAWPRVCRAL